MNDFADWLSPMVVKELRRGLRSRSFLAPFLIVQLMMIVCVLVSLDQDARAAATSFFWLITGAMLLVALPLRGMDSVRGEMKEKTLELLLLTRLSAWRVVAGKWLALFLQTLLLVSALLPYVVLRYFFGGIDLAGEFVILFWLLVANALLTAVCVGVSPFMYGFRGVMAACMIPPLIVLAVAGMTNLGRLSAALPLSGSFRLATAWLLGPLFILSMLEVAVARIVPAAENRAVFQRLLAVAIVAVAALLEAVYDTRGFLGAVALLLVMPTLLGAITSGAPSVPILYGRYRSFGERCGWRLSRRLSWVAGRLLRPGSATGMVFALVILSALALTSGVDLESGRIWQLIVSGIGAFFMPLLLARLFFPGKNRFVIWFCFQIFFFVLALFFSVARTLREHWFANLIPSIDFWLHLFSREVPSKGDPGFYLVCAVTVGSLLLLFFDSRKEWKKIGELEAEATRLEEEERSVASF